MRSELLRVDELHLRLPGLNAQEAEETGRQVAGYVAQGLTPGMKRQTLGELALRISIPTGTPKQHLARIIADKILRAVGK